MKKLIAIYSIIVFSIIAFINPILNYVFVGNISLHSLVLIPFLIISLFLFLKYKEKYFVIGVLTSFVFLLICYLQPNRRSDELFLYTNLAFFSNAIISEKYLGKYKNDKILNFLFLTIAITIIHSFGLAFGFWENSILAKELIGQRIGRSSDIIELLPFTIPFLLLYAKSRPQLSIKVLTFSIILLGILRLIATGIRGITFSVLISILLYLLFSQVSIKKIKFQKVFKLALLFVLVLILSKSYISEQVKSITNQYIEYNMDRGEDTGIARIVEAKNDFNTFKDNPIFGGGFYEASKKTNSLGESSYGHFFLTGMLARLGIVGTLFFLLAYFFYFKKMYNKFNIDKESKFFFMSTLIIVITYFILGNPVYLLLVWPILPIFWGIIKNYSKNETNTPTLL